MDHLVRDNADDLMSAFFGLLGELLHVVEAEVDLLVLIVEL
jgi:hypothetical protein